MAAPRTSANPVNTGLLNISNAIAQHLSEGLKNKAYNDVVIDGSTLDWSTIEIRTNGLKRTASVQISGGQLSIWISPKAPVDLTQAELVIRKFVDETKDFIMVRAKA